MIASKPVNQKQRARLIVSRWQDSLIQEAKGVQRSDGGAHPTGIPPRHLSGIPWEATRAAQRRATSVSRAGYKGTKHTGRITLAVYSFDILSMTPRKKKETCARRSVTATGPSHHTSGFPKTAFSTGSPSDFLHGVNVQGARCGVVDEGLQAQTDTPQGSSNLPGVGVEGRGANFGVVGDWSSGRDCLRLWARKSLQDCRYGPRRRRRIGIVGASVRNLGNPLQTFDSFPEPADGSGTGVLGTSGSGPGVSGSSGEGSGGDFSSQSGVGFPPRVLQGLPFT